MYIKKVKKRGVLYTLRLWRCAFGVYTPQILVLTALGFLSGLLEGVGINALIPLFSLVVGSEDSGSDVISQIIEKAFVYFNIDFGLKYLLIFISLLFFLKALALVFGTYIQVKITSNYEHETRKNLLKETFQARWSFLLKQKVGYLDTVLMTDVHFSAILLQSIGAIIIIITGLLMYTLVAINISPQITLITLIFGVVLVCLFQPFIRRTKIISSEIAKLKRQVAHSVNESVIGTKTIKIMSTISGALDASNAYFKRLRDLRIKNHLFRSITGTLMQPLAIVFIVVVFAFSYTAPAFSLAAFAAVMYLIQRIFTYINQLQTNLHKVNEAFPYLESMLWYQQEVSRNMESGGGMEHFQLERAFEFKNVSFSYDKNRNVLSGMNFQVRAGEFVGLIGSSGAGKTTIVDLIFRLFQPSSGKVLLDGRNISDVDVEEWRKNLGYVSQDIYLSNDTITNNIRFYDSAITDEDIISAAKQAKIYETIQGFADGFDTVVGERGVRLSVGQRQRIIIARVLARKPRFLILDEATSALDNESEMWVQKAIGNLKGKVTVLVIAHRLSTVLSCDRLFVLNDGRIVEQGSPEELLKDESSYFFKAYHIKDSKSL